MAISRFKTSTLAQGLPKYQDVWDGTTTVFDSDYELIETITVGAGGASSVSFTSIPSTYKHLQIRGITRCTKADTGAENLIGAFNSDTTHTNYRSHVLEGFGSSASAGTIQLSGFYASIGLSIGNNALANAFSVFVTDILDYTNTNKFKTVRMLSGVDTNGYGGVNLRSTLWMSTSAINSITLSLYNANNHAQYSSFDLYGIKGV
jgi:hypothetical protein